VTLLAPPAPPGLSPGPRPTFSVIIASYQAAAWVEDAVRSALAQTEPPLEVIVCDDGSTDATAEVLAPFGAAITVLRQDNRGEAGARNTAIAAASGDVLAILDADDLFVPERLARLGDAFEARPDLDVITTDAWIELDGERVRRAYEGGYRFPVTAQREAILRDNFVFGICAVRRSLVVEAGGYDEAIRYATDWDLWLRLILGGARVGCLMEPLAAYRLQRGSLSSRLASMLAGRVAILEKAARRGDLSGEERAVLERALRDYRAQHAVERAREALRAGAPGARALSLRAVGARGLGVRTRVKLLAGATVPGPVGARLRERPVATTAGLLLAPTPQEGSRSSGPSR
jgi:glycosyltransferase involved in cell wall biosynthesis